jgi:hypothetical protein
MKILERRSKTSFATLVALKVKLSVVNNGHSCRLHSWPFLQKNETPFGTCWLGTLMSDWEFTSFLPIFSSFLYLSLRSLFLYLSLLSLSFSLTSLSLFYISLSYISLSSLSLLSLSLSYLSLTSLSLFLYLFFPLLSLFLYLLLSLLFLSFFIYFSLFSIYLFLSLLLWLKIVASPSLNQDWFKKTNCATLKNNSSFRFVFLVNILFFI